MSLQPLFRRFHETIQLTNDNQNAELRQKRDNILARLREQLRPRTFEFFNQGSYAMGTGVKPIHGDYDIDIGIVFDLDYRTQDPHEVKEWVYKAARGHTQDVRWRRPCITVNYQQAHALKYHVDIAVMVRDSQRRLRLALCKQNAQADLRQWQLDGRLAFMDAIGKRFAGEDEFQFCRVIRYLKRWKDVHFPHEGRSAPTGLSLTIAAYRWFKPTKSTVFPKTDYDDLAAIRALILVMLQNFLPVQQGGKPAERLVLKFPHEPHDDVLESMSSEQMSQFKGRLQKLLEWVDEARKTQSPAPLQRAFGSQFPTK